MLKRKKAFSALLSLVLLASFLCFQLIRKSDNAIVQFNNKLTLSSDYLVKISESVKELEARKSDGTIEVKQALVTEYLPKNSNEYLLARGRYSLDKTITKVVISLILMNPKKNIVKHH